MQQRGLLIRLIDVGLIILLGFVCISDINIRAQIKLPSPSNRKEDINRQYVVYYLVLHKNNRVSILDPGHSPTEWKNLRLKTLETRMIRLRNNFKRQGKILVMLIEPEPDATMQFLVDVLDLCQKNQILKNIANKALEL